MTATIPRRTGHMPGAMRGRNGRAALTAQPVLPLTEKTTRRWQRHYSRRLLITDSVIVCAAVLFAQYVRFGESPSASGYPGQLMTLYSVLFAGLWLSSIAVFNTRSTRVIGAGIDEYRRVSTASFWTFGIIAMATLLAKVELARGYLAIALPLGTIGLLASRVMWRHHLARMRARGKCQTMVVAVGDRPGVSHLVHQLTRNPSDGYVVVGVGIPGYGASRGKTLMVHGQQIPILGDETYALAAAGRCNADTVAVTGAERFGVQGSQS